MDARTCIAILRKEGYRDSRVERVMGFPKGSLGRVYEKNHSNRTNMALLRVLGCHPFLVEVAETGYNTEFAKDIERLWVSKKLLESMRYV